MLHCEALKQFFGSFCAIDNCTLSIPSDSITGLIGPNGAGKTTLFNLIAGAYQPTGGTITFCGQDITFLTPDKRFAKGLVRTFQIPHEFQHLTVIENLMMVAPDQPGEGLLQNWFAPGRVHRVEEETRRKAWEVLEFIELTHIADQLAGLVSGGQKKLLELGRTMMTDSKLVLLDEPAAGVNRTLLRKIEDKIAYLHKERGYTFILIEHDMEMIEKLCDPVICMADGRVLIEGDFKSVRSDPRVLEAYLGEKAGTKH
ncbi:MAG: ABC transporter ATP-binding protein [Mesorhizobium sp.]|uniref:ABC transporter ATP-binding protein n=1 Tax=Mesorhizobium sp. TaxID=1871066 RepID=UPI001ACE59DE|nr:ABC transporter ATP-binding protein [Mesorhizobium sp.]MBN9221264.1 ABC transporter ATP-binding protein [Mesorhizobium sp.]